MRHRLAMIARIVTGGFLAVVGLFLGWEAIASAPSWSNGLMEGLSYALGAVLLVQMASLLWRDRGTSPVMYLCLALLLLLPAGWCIRWTVWFLADAAEIGPCPPLVPLLFGGAAGLFLVAAGMLILRVWRR